jgi:hypothetical protein
MILVAADGKIHQEKRGEKVSGTFSFQGKERVATVSVFLTVGFSHARYPNGNRT